MTAAPTAKKAPPINSVGLQTFANESDRARLTGTALRAYRSLSRHWGLNNTEASGLLGVSGSTWDRIKREDRSPAPLSQDQLTRISALTGIFKGLHLLFADEMANRWPRLQNEGPLFGRRTPIEAMVEGGIPSMIEVRRYVDAVRGGL
jgi:uncharacterized protein (DUF2384 family)